MLETEHKRETSKNQTVGAPDTTSPLSLRLWLAASILLSAAMAFSTIGLGWFDDDYIHRVMVDGRYNEASSPTDLYCFVGGPKELESTKFHMWWSHPKTSHCSFRPLAGLSLTFDHQFFAHQPWAAHLHSILLFAIFATAVWLLTRQLFGLRAATFALLCVGLGKHMFESVGWIAARHSILGAAFGGIAVVCFLTEEPNWRRRACAWAALIASLASSEASLGVLAIVIVYPFLVERGSSSLVTRLREAAPKFALGLAYVGFYFVQGYGAKANAAYSSFDDGIVHTVWQVVVRFVAIIGEWIFGFASSLVEIPEERVVPLSAGGLAFVLLGALARIAWPLFDSTKRQTVSALTLAGLAALAPGLLAHVSGRILTISLLALMPALAALLDGAWSATRVGLTDARRNSSASKRSTTGGAYVSSVARYVVLGAVLGGLLVINPLHRLQAQAWALERSLAEDEVSTNSFSICPDSADVLVLSSRDLFSSLFGPYLFLPAGDGRRGHYALTAADANLELERTSPHELRLSAPHDGTVLGGFIVRIRRPDNAPLATGDRLTFGNFEVEPSQVSTEGVSEIRLRDPRGFSDDAVCFVQARFDEVAKTLRFERVSTPSIGKPTSVAFLEDPFLWY